MVNAIVTGLIAACLINATIWVVIWPWLVKRTIYNGKRVGSSEIAT